VRDLLNVSYDVIAVDIVASRLQTLFHGNEHCKIHTANILDEDLESLIDEGDKVLHLAAVPRFAEARENPQKAVRVNVEGTLNLIQTCIKKKAERLVYVSTGSVYSRNVPVPIREDATREPESVYGLTKKQAEDWIIFYGNRLPYVILRYGYVYGKGKDWGAVGAFLKHLKEGKRPIVFGGKQTNDFIYIKDIVQANLLALETPYVRKAFNIGSGRATSIRNVCEYCIKASNSNLKMKLEVARVFDYPIFVYNIEKARILLHYEPEYGLLDGVTELVNQLKSE